MSFGYFILAGATLGLKNASLFVFLSGLIHTDTCNDTSGQIVGKISSSSLRKAPFFFLLASDLGNFGRVAWQSQTKLEHKPAVRQVRLRQILACHGERNVHFLLRFNELSKSPLLSFWLANVATDLNGTPAGSLMTKPTHLNFCYLWNFLIWLYAVPLDIKTHPSPGNDSLPSHLTDAIYVALLLFILSQREMIEWLCGFSQENVELHSMKSASSGDHLSWGDFHRQLFGNCMKSWEDIRQSGFIRLIDSKLTFHTNCDPVRLEGSLPSPPYLIPLQPKAMLFPPTPRISKSMYVHCGNENAEN